MLVNSTRECDSLYTTQAGLNLVHSYGNFAMCSAITLRCSRMLACLVDQVGLCAFVSCDCHVTFAITTINMYTMYLSAVMQFYSPLV